MENRPVVMITGASKGLGKALAITFAENGADLALCARGEDKLMDVKNEVEKLGARVIAVTADMLNPSDVDRFVSLAEAGYGHIDVLINNASMFGPGPVLLADYPDEEFKKVLLANVFNPFLVTKRVLPGMLARNTGSIINVTSEAGKTGFAEWGAYGISKFAVEGLTQTWADELQNTGVRLNLVDPGEMNTEMHEIAVPDCDYPIADPKECVEVFLYLASKKSASIHGQRFEAQLFSEKRVQKL